ncbi:glycosyltransferase family 2 protein [Candidatus Pacearchaeota archaeon]|nr:glycosyltransferase family 2 protein [Candidatus Pacearchaeota archaeon]
MKELVSITIPTYNNKKTLRKTLESVKKQTYENIEIIIIDSNSTDGTLEIINEFKNVKVFQYEGTLLGARGIGVKKAKGKFIALVDSDHILDSNTIKNSVKSMKEFDMAWFYERSWKPKRLLEILYDADRELVQKYSKDFINPIGGVILPRFYKKDILIKAFENMPKKILPLCVAHDHAIIYLEAYKLSKKLGKIGNEEKPAIFHQEPWSWTNLFKKTYRYGVTTRKLVENKVYPKLLQSKNKGRKIKFADLGLSFKSNVLRFMRAMPYLYGYYTGKNKKIPGL